MTVSKTAALSAPLILASLPAMAEGPITTAPIIVTAPTRTPIEAVRTGSSVTVLTEEDLAAEPRPNLAEALQRVPGVAIANRGAPGSSTEVSIRGFGAEDILVRIDGIEFADPGELRTQADFGQILTGDVTRLEVLRGAQSALYGGEAAGGIVDLTTGRARGTGLGGRGFVEFGSFETFQSSFTGGYGDDTWDLSFSGQVLDTDGFSAEPGGEEDDGSRNITVAAVGSADLTETVTVGGAFRFFDRETDIDRVSGGNVLDAPFDEAASQITAGRAYANHLSFDDRLLNEVSVQVLSSAREFDQEVAGFSRFEGDRIKVEYLGTLELNPMISALAGADWTMEEVETSDDLEADSTITGGFGQLIVTPIETLTLTAAGRFDSHSDFGGFFTWRGTAAWEARPGTILRGAVAKGFRAPSNRELFTPAGIFGPVGNPDLEPEESLTWEVGVDQTFFDGRVIGTATYFESRTDELIEFVFGTGFDNITGESERRGVEVGLNIVLWEGAEATMNYTFLDTEDPSGAPLDFAPKHDLTAAFFVTPIDRLRLGLRASYLAGVFDDGTQLDDFVLLDLNAAYAVAEDVEFYVRVENALDQDYERVEGFATAGVSAFGGVRASF